MKVSSGTWIFLDLRHAVQIFKCMINQALTYQVNMFQKRFETHKYNNTINNNLK